MNFNLKKQTKKHQLTKRFFFAFCRNFCLLLLVLLLKIIQFPVNSEILSFFVVTSIQDLSPPFPLPLAQVIFLICYSLKHTGFKKQPRKQTKFSKLDTRAFTE